MDKKRILVATALTDTSESALLAAAELAAALGAELTLIHVLAHGRTSVLPGSHKPTPEQVMAADAEQGAALKRQRERALADVEDVRLQLVAGESAAEAIVSQAESMRADYVVLGTHGRTGIAHALMGSVAEAVVKKAPCPVVVVPP